MATSKRPVSSRDLWRLRFAGDVRLSPEGARLVWVETRINAEENRYESAIYMAVRLEDGSYGATRRLTFGKLPGGSYARDRSPTFSPDGSRLAFTSNRAGTNDIWLLDLKNGGEARRLGQKSQGASQVAWSPCGRYIAYVAREPRPAGEADPQSLPTGKDVTVVTHLRYKANGVPGVVDPRPRHIYILDTETAETRQLTSGDYNDANPVFSPDGRTVAFTSCREEDRELVYIPDLWTVPFKGGNPVKLTCGKGPVRNLAFSPDGKWIAFLGHEKREDSVANTEVLVIPSGGGPVKNIWGHFNRSVGCGITSDARFDGGSSGPFWSADNKYVYFIASDRGYSGIYRAGLRGGVELVGGATPGNIHACPRFPAVISSLDVKSLGSAQILAFTGSTTLNPCDIYSVTLPDGACSAGPASCRLQQVTHVNQEFLSGLSLSKPERFTFRSKDGLELDGWMMKPASFEPGKKYPAIIEIHGGPHSSYGETFFFEFQVLASRGYGIFCCNPRGSSGYGPEFARKVVGDWGKMDYEDIMVLTDYASSLDWVDAARLGVTGGSYGGYMTNWIVGHTSRFRAAVTQRSISNMYTKYGTSDIGWYGNKRGMGGRDLWDSEDFLMERSPIRYAPSVTTPLLIIHSELDYRCPMEQAEQWYVALKRLGKEVEFVRFAGENHELSRSGKPWNRVERLDHIARWFDKHLTDGN